MVHTRRQQAEPKDASDPENLFLEAMGGILVQLYDPVVEEPFGRIPFPFEHLFGILVLLLLLQSRQGKFLQSYTSLRLIKE